MKEIEDRILQIAWTQVGGEGPPVLRFNELKDYELSLWPQYLKYISILCLAEDIGLYNPKDKYFSSSIFTKLEDRLGYTIIGINGSYLVKAPVNRKHEPILVVQLKVWEKEYRVAGRRLNFKFFPAVATYYDKERLFHVMPFKTLQEIKYPLELNDEIL